MAWCPVGQMEALGPWACFQLVVVTEPEVRVESKEIRFLGKDPTGLRPWACTPRRGPGRLGGQTSRGSMGNSRTLASGCQTGSRELERFQGAGNSGAQQTGSGPPPIPDSSIAASLSMLLLDFPPQFPLKKERVVVIMRRGGG